MAAQTSPPPSTSVDKATPAVLLQEALSAPDSDASRAQLAKLTAYNVPLNGTELPAIATKCLDVFCADAESTRRRRWTGLALCKLINTSEKVVERLSNTKELTKVGPMILRKHESEETRIVAGLIIRQALAQGIDVKKCWPSLYIPNNSFFPEADASTWMHAFQQFLDELEDVKVAEFNTDSAIHYPISISTSADFAAVMGTLIIENHILTVITLDPAMHTFNFLDLPLRHISRTSIRKATLHGSQERLAELEPWDVLIDLKPDGTYILNEQEAMSKEIAMLFQHQKDAKACETDIAKIIGAGPSKSGVTTRSRSSQNFSANGGENQSPGSQRKRRAPPEPTLTPLKEIGPSPRQLSIRNETNSKDGNSVMDELDITDSSPKMRQTSQNSNGSSARTRTPVLWGTENGILGRMKLGGGKPKPKTTGSILRDRRKVHECEDEQDSLSSRDTGKPEGSKADPMENNEPDPPEPDANASSNTKRLRLPRAYKLGNKRKQAEKRASSDEVYDFPSEEESNPRPLKKRRNDEVIINDSLEDAVDSMSQTKRKMVADEAIYIDSESSESDDSESDYVETKPKARQSAGKRTIQARQSKPKESKILNAKDGKASRATKAKALDVRRTAKTTSDKKAKPPNKQADSISSVGGGKVSKAKGRGKTKQGAADARSVSPVKHPLLSNLVSESRAITSSSASNRTPKQQTKAVNDKHPTKTVVAKQSAKGVVEKHVLVQVHNTSSPSKVASETRTLEKLNKDPADVCGSPRGGGATKAGDGRTAANDPLHEEENVNDFGTDEAPLQDSGLAKQSTMLKRKLIATSIVSESPRTPKRTKPSAAPNVPTTMGPPRLRHMDDPSSSPSVDKMTQRSARVGLKNITPQSPIKRGSPTAIDELLSSGALRTASATLKSLLIQGQTPAHRSLHRTTSLNSVPGELLSSNSKPVPAQGNAESTAISCHADRGEVDLQKELGDRETAKSDPFKGRSKLSKENSFMRRLTGEPLSSGQLNSRANTPHNTDDHAPLHETLFEDGYLDMDDENYNIDDEDFDMNGDDTLVAPEEEDESLPMRDTPTHYHSSPPLSKHVYSGSSHSSTSAVPAEPSEPSDPDIDGTTLIEEEDREWEDSLKPHQRALGAQLTRITRRVLQHVVDSESAVHNVAEMYADDGKKLVDDVRGRYSEQFAKEIEGAKKKGKVVKSELGRTAAKLAEERKRLVELPNWLVKLAD